MPKGVYPRKKRPVLDRLFDMAIPEPNSGCWLFTGSTNNKGYGQIRCSGKTHLAHRISFEALNGSAGGKHILHQCDTPLCVNPEHLWVGTQKDNIIDMWKKKRSPTFGESHPFSRLTDTAVREIKSSSEKGRDLAKRFNASEATISMIRRGHTWKHI